MAFIIDWRVVTRNHDSCVTFQVFNMEKYKLDMENGCGLPQWVVITGLVSELLLAVNSSINFFIYCFMSSLFR